MNRDDDLGGSRRTSVSSRLTAEFLGIDPEDAENLTYAQMFNQMTPAAKAWVVTKGLLMIGLIIFPVLTLTLEEVKAAWWSPIMGILACALPACGMPIAGGIVFYPILTTRMPPFQVVTFSMWTQAIGVGVLAPMNWLFKRPDIFLWWSMLMSIVFSMCGEYFMFGLFGQLPTFYINCVFTGFAFALACFVAHGLIKDTIATDQYPIKYTPMFFVWMVIAGFSGGILAYCIGIGVEKTVFAALTGYSHTDSNKAAISSISVVGLLSLVAGVAFEKHRIWTPDNHVPFVYWVMVLPGILIGSVVGPVINDWLGKKKILTGFLLLLIADVVKTAYEVGLEIETGDVPWNTNSTPAPAPSPTPNDSNHSNSTLAGALLQQLLN
jgi:uncharacterized membrane protein YfcA